MTFPMRLPMTLGEPTLLTYDEVADQLHVSRSTARRYAKAGLLEVVKLTERTHRVHPSSVRQLIASRSAARAV